MSLIKRTIVLSKDIAKGYITIIRLGTTVGAKLILNSPIGKDFWLALKVGNNEQIMMPIDGERMEIDLDINFISTDIISVVVLDERGQVFAQGGQKDIINIKEIRQRQDELIAIREGSEKTNNALNNDSTTSADIDDTYTNSQRITDDIIPINNNQTETDTVATINKDITAENTSTISDSTAKESINADTANSADTATTSAHSENVADTRPINESQTKTNTVETVDKDITAKNASTISDNTAKENINADTANSADTANTDTHNENVADTRPINESQTKTNTVETVKKDITAENASTIGDNTAKENINADTANASTHSEEEVNEDVEIEFQVPEEKNPFHVPRDDNFYQSIRSRLDEIMTINPRMAELERLIPDSKWVKINYDGDDYYVVGVLTDENIATHIAYGVPGYPHIKPPKEAEDLCDFLPLSPNSGKGYWLMFQDAQNGEIIRN